MATDLLKISILFLSNCFILGRTSQIQNVDIKSCPSSLPDSKPCDFSTSSCCVPFIKCPAHLTQIETKKCVTSVGKNGICCTSGSNFTEKMRGNRHVMKINYSMLNYLRRSSREKISELRVREIQLESEKSAILDRSTASYSHFRNSRISSPTDLHQVMTVATKALEIALATKAFRDRMGITNDQWELDMGHTDLTSTPMGGSCAPKPFCIEIHEKYRRIDGACNNKYHHSWGSNLTPYSRLLPPNYEDGVWSPRLSKIHKNPLESPRKISVTLFRDENAYQSENTLLLMQFGQFLAHDITQSIDTSYRNGSAVGCCKFDGSSELSEKDRHYACMPIDIPEDDPFYSVFKQRCMNFVRSTLAPRQDCTLGYAEQMNKVTHFIDASSIYGSTPEQTGHLRSFQDGKLLIFNDFGRDLLPLNRDNEACINNEQGAPCFASGDTRTNQMLTLVVLHTLFMREHNRIAGELKKINPFWGDEKLFLETRQIMMAELQVIVFKEFLPAVIGDEAMNEFQLNLKENNEYSYDYKPEIEPSILNEFASAAFRFGHSIVDGQLKAYGMKKMEEMIFIPEIMFQPSRMRKRHFFDQILSTLTTEPIQEVDQFFSDALTKYMFRGGNPFGVDLASFNIQRGRDHGIRSYNDYRELIGLRRFTFEDFGEEKADALRRVYESVDDIDLWVGGLMENEKPKGSIVGHVFQQIIAEQFSRLKNGDRYFHENSPSINPGYFTEEQLVELRKVTISRIICDNSDGILLGKQARNAFKRPGMPGNEVVDCDSDLIPRMNLKYWNEN